jgi:hypothetical protein
MKPIKTLVVAIAGLVLAAASSHAALTTVNSAPSGEWNLDAGAVNIMDYLYGSGYTRVDDSSDIQWVGTSGNASMEAIYAGANQSLYSTALDGSDQQQINIDTTHTIGAPSRTAPIVAFSPTPQPFLFLDEANGNMAYSDPALSSGGVDRMVTFLITGYMSDPGNTDNQFVNFTDGPHYVIAFEDGSDFDFNDLVVEVKGVAPVPVPEPTTMIAGALLLLPFGASTLRILRRNRAA